MPKTQPLCTGTELNLRGRFLSEVYKNSFIALPGKGGHSGLLPLKMVCPNLGGFGKEFYSNGSRAELLIRLGCVQCLHSFNLGSGNLFFLFSFFVCLFWFFFVLCFIPPDFNLLFIYLFYLFYLFIYF